MARSRSALLLVLVVLPLLGLLGCTKKGEECAACSSNDDCKIEQGLMCSRFADGKMRCGSGVGATICGR